MLGQRHSKANEALLKKKLYSFQSTDGGPRHGALGDKAGDESAVLERVSNAGRWGADDERGTLRDLMLARPWRRRVSSDPAAHSVVRGLLRFIPGLRT